LKSKDGKADKVGPIKEEADETIDNNLDAVSVASADISNGKKKQP
jgi:hypothetical protein